MKKYLAIILAILTFAAAFPPIVGSAAEGPVPLEISARAEKELIENFDLVPGSDGNGNEYYDYNINDANPMITVKCRNGKIPCGLAVGRRYVLLLIRFCGGRKSLEGGQS